MRAATINRSGHVVGALGLIILILVIGACGPTSQSPHPTEQIGTVVAATENAPENDSTPEPEATRDLQINSQDSEATASANLADAQVLDLSNPLRFDFSTYTPVPTLDWRPPPMPVPVSIRPEDHFWFARPLASDTVSWPDPFYRYGNTYFGFMRLHSGVDLDADSGTPVLAAGSGKVVWVGWGLFGIRPKENDPYGLAIAIKHDFGYQGLELYTVYAHLSEDNVWLDQPVAEGDVIGWSGSTGNSSGPHLHFEVRVGKNEFGSTRNPELWLAPPRGWGVIAGRILDKYGRYVDDIEFTIRNEFGQNFLMWAYGPEIAIKDDAYMENFVLSDLPAGEYRIDVPLAGTLYRADIEVYAGQTSFVVIQEGGPPRVGLANPHTPPAPAPTITPTPSNTPTQTPVTPVRLGRPSATPTQ